MDILDKAEAGILGYLKTKKAGGQLAANYYQDAVKNVLPALRDWYNDPAIDKLSPRLKEGINQAITKKDWAGLVNAFVRSVTFGTGGIRSLMAYDKESIIKLKEEGIDAPILKGPNTINNIVILRTAWGVARFLVAKYGVGAKVVVGYDSRIRGESFCKIIAELLLAEGLNVYLFDEPVPYPEVTFAIPNLGAEMGIFISASHNDYRYNGFKLSGPNGAQILPEIRTEILNYISQARPSDIQLAALETAEAAVLERLYWLGGSEPLPDRSYYDRASGLIDMHRRHVEQVKKFLLRKTVDGQMEGLADLCVVYAAFNGSGRRAVPRILTELGCRHLHRIQSLDPLNGLFPVFKSDPGQEQQPDPGDPRSAEIALAELAKDSQSDTYIPWPEADLLLSTDPDADRCGIMVKPSPALAKVLTDQHVLISADEMWTLLVWYRLQYEIEKYGQVQNPEQRFIALSHTTTDMVGQLARKYGLGVLKTWVGFGWLSNAVAQAWAGTVPSVAEGRRSAGDAKCDLVFYDTAGMNGNRKINDATMEQSNGFSILGGPPDDPDRSLGVDGHVRDKDGTFAALLVTEVVSYAKKTGIDIFTLLSKHIYSDPDIGLFVNYYEPDPLDGEYPGLEGDSKKKRILDVAEALYQAAQAGGLSLGRRVVKSAVRYTTGKYDAANWPGFPDEGLRFYFDTKFDYLTIRPSGTSNALRFHVQFYGGPVGESEVWQKRADLEKEARDLITELREKFGIPRPAGVQF